MATTLLSKLTGQAQVVPVMGPNTPYSLVVGAVTTPPTFGTVVSNAYWTREGTTSCIEVNIAQSTAGTAGSGTYLFPLPAGQSIDTSLITPAMYDLAGQAVVGVASFRDGSKTYVGTVNVYNATTLEVILGNEITSPIILSAANFPTTSATWRLSFMARVPITGWDAVVAQGAGLALADRAGLVAKKESGSFTANVTGPFTTTSLVRYVKVDNIVTMQFGGASGVATVGAPITIDMTNCPASVRSVNTQSYVAVQTINNSVLQTTPGMAVFAPAANTTVYLNGAAAIFTGTGNCSFSTFSVSYVTT